MSTISASTTTTTAYKVTADTTGTLVLQTGSTPTTAVTIDTSQNVGLGVTPSAWSTFKGLQIVGGSLMSFSNAYVDLFQNTYYDGSNLRYVNTGFASYYRQNSGVHSWNTAASGSAGGVATFTQAMTLDASGNLGVGVTSPAARLDVVNNSTYQLRVASTANNYSDGGIYLGALGTSDPYYSGRITYTQSTETLNLINNSSSINKGGIVFLIATTTGSPVEKARIDTSGKLLVGLTSSVTYLDGAINGTSSGPALCGKTTGGNSTYAQVLWNNDTTGNNAFVLFGTEATYTIRGSITYNRAGGLTAYNTTSDYRAKTVNGPVENALSKVALLKPSTGRMNGASQDIDFFVAHELQEVVPSAVTGEKDAVNEDGTPNYQMVDKSALIPLLAAAIQEQQAIIETLTNRITALEAK